MSFHNVTSVMCDMHRGIVSSVFDIVPSSQVEVRLGVSKVAHNDPQYFPSNESIQSNEPVMKMLEVDHKEK